MNDFFFSFSNETMRNEYSDRNFEILFAPIRRFFFFLALPLEAQKINDKLFLYNPALECTSTISTLPLH